MHSCVTRVHAASWGGGKPQITSFVPLSLPKCAQIVPDVTAQLLLAETQVDLGMQIEVGKTPPHTLFHILALAVPHAGLPVQSAIIRELMHGHLLLSPWPDLAEWWLGTLHKKSILL